MKQSLSFNEQAREVVISVSASSLISFGVSVSKIGTIIQFRLIRYLSIKSIALIQKSIIIDYSQRNLLSIFIQFRIKLINFYRLLSNAIDYPGKVYIQIFVKSLS